jgi:hypothetical protein
VLGTLAVAAAASLGVDAWLNAEDAFYGSSGGGVAPGCAPRAAVHVWRNHTSLTLTLAPLLYASFSDVAGAALWGVALFYASPLQLLVLFLGRIDVERPSDETLRCAASPSSSRAPMMHTHTHTLCTLTPYICRRLHRLLGMATGQPVDAAEYEAPPALRVANGALFALAGAAVALGCSAALGGEATWSVSTGLGAALAAGVYEVGRPPRLSAAQAVALDAEWSDFRAFANARLARKGRCHISEVDKAYRKFSPTYRAAARARDGDDGAGGNAAAAAGVNAAGDADLRNFIANWNPDAERSSSGFYKGLSVLPEEAAPPRA